MKTIVTQSRIAVVGLGQLGSSLAMRLHSIGAKGVYGIARSEQALAEAQDKGFIDYGSTDPFDVLPVVDIAFLCIPLTPTLSFVDKNLDAFRSGSIVTDVGSVKGSIVETLRPKLLEKGVYFFGSHPMAGTEKSGMEHASPDLYDNRICFVTPHPEDDHDALDILHRFWREIGCRVIELDANRHDQACAFTSHMLHMVSAAIVQSVLGHGDTEANELACSGGFRDVSRIASSNVNMWVEICKHNRMATLNALTDFQGQLTDIQEAITNENWDALSSQLEAAKSARDHWHDTIFSAKIFNEDSTEPSELEDSVE